MKKTPPLSVAMAFIVVALPLGWGLYRSVRNSLPLFTAGKAAAPAPIPPAAPQPPAK
jgi:hypothetical protein